MYVSSLHSHTSAYVLNCQGMQVLGIIKRFCALTCGNGGGIGMGSHGRDARECSKGEICAETLAKIRKIDAFSSAPPKRN